MSFDNLKDQEITNINFELSTVICSTPKTHYPSKTTIHSTEPSKSVDTSMFSNTSLTPKKSYSVFGTIGYSNEIDFDSESQSFLDEDEEDKILHDESWDSALEDLTDDEADKLLLGIGCPLQCHEGNLIINDRNCEVEMDKNSGEKSVCFNREVKLNSNENTNTDIKDNYRENLIPGQRLVETERKENIGDTVLEDSFDLNELASHSSSPSTTQDVSTQKEDVSSSSFLSESRAESFSVDKKLSGENSEMNQYCCENFNSIDTAETNAGKELLAAKSTRSRRATIVYLESLKSKTESLRRIYSTIKNQITKSSSLKKFSAPNYFMSVSENSVYSRVYSPPLNDMKRFPKENNLSCPPFITFLQKKQDEPDTLPSKEVGFEDSSITGDNSSVHSCCNFQNKSGESMENISESNILLPKSEFIASDIISLKSQKRELFDKYLHKNEERNDLRTSSQEDSAGLLMSYKEGICSKVFDIAQKDSLTPLSYKQHNSEDSLPFYCASCKKAISKTGDKEKAQRKKNKKNPVEHKVISVPATCSIDVFLQLFNTDNILARNILLALSCTETSNGMTHTEILKFLRKKKIFSIKLLKVVKSFLETALNAGLLKMRGRRYILAENCDYGQNLEKASTQTKKCVKDISKRNSCKTAIERKRKIQNDVRKSSEQKPKFQRVSLKSNHSSKHKGMRALKKESKAVISSPHKISKLSGRIKLTEKRN